MTRNHREPIFGVLSTTQRSHWKLKLLKVQDSIIGGKRSITNPKWGEIKNFNLLTHKMGLRKTYLPGSLWGSSCIIHMKVLLKYSLQPTHTDGRINAQTPNYLLTIVFLNIWTVGGTLVPPQNSWKIVRIQKC